MEREVILTVKEAYLVEIETFLFNPLTTNLKILEKYDLDILKDQLRTGRGFKPLKENNYFYLVKDKVNVILSDDKGYVIDAFGILKKLIQEREKGQVIKAKALYLITENTFTDLSFIEAQIFLENSEVKLKLLKGIPRKVLILNLYKGNYLFVGVFLKETSKDGDKYYQGYPLLCLRSFNPNKLKQLIKTLIEVANNEIGLSFIILFDKKSFSLLLPENKKELLLSPLPILDIAEVDSEKWLEEVLRYFKKTKLCFKSSDLKKVAKKIIETLKSEI